MNNVEKNHNHTVESVPWNGIQEIQKAVTILKDQFTNNQFEKAAFESKLNILEQKIITFKEENEAQSERKAIAATENDINALKEKYAEILKKSEEQVENLKTSVGKIAVGGSKEFIAENGRWNGNQERVEAAENVASILEEMKNRPVVWPFARRIG